MYTQNLKVTVKKMNSTEVQNPWCKLVVFDSVLACAKTAHVFQKLSYSLCGLALSLSLVTNNSSSDSKAFLRFIAFSGSPTAVHCAFLFYKLMRRHGYSHKLTLSHALRYFTVGKAFWNSRKRQSQTSNRSKFDRKTTIPRAPSTWSYIYRYIRVTERYMETLHVKKIVDLCHCGKFITLLTFELRSFTENGFLILLHFPRCSCWCLSLEA